MEEIVIKPDVDYEKAKELIQRLYGFKVLSIKEMVSYDDRNFYIQISSTHENSHINSISEDGYTLKITNTEKTAIPGHFESIHSTFEYLNKKGLRVPIPVPNLEGKKWTTEKMPLVSKHENSADHSPSYGSCGIHLLTYIPGDIISAVFFTEEIIRQWGQLLAKFHIALQDFSNELLHGKDVFWSYYHLSDLRNFIDGLDQKKSEFVLNILKHCEENQPILNRMPKGYIHGDLNEANVLLRKLPSGYVVDGILDLEDTHLGPYVWDVAVMLAYVSLGCEDIDPIDGMGYALDSYLQLKPLSEKEIGLLKVCVVGRLCQSLVLGAYKHRQDPSNFYLLKTAKTGWQILDLIWNISNETILRRWNDIRKNA